MTERRLRPRAFKLFELLNIVSRRHVERCVDRRQVTVRSHADLGDHARAIAAEFLGLSC